MGGRFDMDEAGEQPTAAEQSEPQETQDGQEPATAEQTTPEFDGDGQAIVPGTEPEPAEDEEREPRSEEDIAADFRMAVFSGQIKTITEDWNSGRKLKIVVESGDRLRVASGLNNFSIDDDLVFRVLPRQPLLADKEPEEFGTKVPRFGVAMIERLERKSCEGYAGWELMDPTEISKRMSLIMAEIFEANDDEDAKAISKTAIDMANFAFFLWWTTETARKKSEH